MGPLMSNTEDFFRPHLCSFNCKWRGRWEEGGGGKKRGEEACFRIFKDKYIHWCSHINVALITWVCHFVSKPWSVVEPVCR